MLPRALCTCEIGFWPTHVEEDCKAGGHKKLELPYTCPIDHYLDPPALAESKVLTRALALALTLTVTVTVTLALALALALSLTLALALALALTLTLTLTSSRTESARSSTTHAPTSYSAHGA